MWLSLFLSDARRHPVQFPARAFDLALRLFLSRAIHFRQGFAEPPAGATQDGNRHFQVVLESGRGWPGGRRLPLRFQKQSRLRPYWTRRRRCNWSFTNSTGDGNICESASRTGSGA